MFGFYRMAAVTPRTVVADVASNLSEHLKLYREAERTGAALAVFPELSLTGASCGDLFRQEVLLRSVWSAALELAAATGNAIAVFGLPVRCGNGLFNMAAVAADGRMLALIPKRSADGVFRSGSGLDAEVSGVPVVDGAVFDCGFRFAVEPGDDRMFPDGGVAALSGGAVVVANPVAEPFMPGFDAGAEAAALSGRFGGVYVTAAAGTGESTTDAVFAGNSRIGDRGRCAVSAESFSRGSGIVYFDADLDAVRSLRMSDRRFADCPGDGAAFKLPEAPGAPDLKYAFNPASPFLPEHDAERFCSDVLNIQTAGLAKRLEHTRAKSMVIGVSGGLDSTLALVVMARCRALLGLPDDSIRAFTLPGFGTTGQTRGNADKLCRALNVDLRTVDITAACRRHFADLGHDGTPDAVFENAQARERTQVLMDAANMYGGILVGTGDLSELALGWCTYNGDQMSMYSVNGSVPKTLIPILLEYEARRLGDDSFSQAVDAIIGTPISPELLPLSADGALAQKTEEVVGPYELHDFFIYHTLASGAAPDKLAYLARAAFAGRYSDAEIDKWLRVFSGRFITQQFKRSAMPDGAAAGWFSLSPRGGWNMPSDASPALWKTW